MSEENANKELSESIQALMDEFEKISDVCAFTQEDMVKLLLLCYEEGYYGSKELAEEAVLGVLKRFMEDNLQELNKKRNPDKKK